MSTSPRQHARTPARPHVNRTLRKNLPDNDSHVTRPRITAVLLAAVLLVAATQLFFYFRDNFSTHYPVKAVSADAFRSGHIPLWNFHAGGGQPLAGNPNTLTFYPDNVLYLFLPASVAFNLHFLLHLLAAFFAMRALLEAREIS